MNDTQNELERLRQEVAQLRKAHAERSTPSVPGFLDDAPNLPALRDNHEFIQTMARFADGTLEEKYVRRKYHLLNEAAWTALGKDDALVEKIEEEKILRIRSGATKRELAQRSVVKAPAILESLLLDPKQSAKHRIDSAKTLDQLAGNTPDAAVEQDRIIIRIDLSGDSKLKDPNDILVIETTKRPDPNPNDAKIVDHSTPMIEADSFNQQEAVPPRRGRPPGSKNKPKLNQQEPLPGFAIDADHL